MKLKEMRRKTLALIEELNPENENLTDDPDIAAKFKDVANQVQYELARMKKIPRYVEIAVVAGQIITFADIAALCEREIYQLCKVGGVRNDRKANGTVVKALESGTAEIECFVYPRRIGEGTDEEDYEFDLSEDALELMPYGIAADLLKSDASADYGKKYEERFETMLQRLDPRYSIPSFYVEGGVMI